MPTRLSVQATHQGEMRFHVRAGEHQVRIDYPAGPAATGFTPLQLLLASLAGCSGETVYALLQRADQPVRGLVVQARGERQDEHPTRFAEVELEFEIQGGHVTHAAVERALKLAEQRMSPVWNMLSETVPIRSSFRILP